jgi:hypothetical protein
LVQVGSSCFCSVDYTCQSSLSMRMVDVPPISPAQRVGRPITHVTPRSTRRRTHLREASACVGRFPRQRDSAISGRMLDCRVSSTGIRQPVSFRRLVPGSPFCTGSQLLTVGCRSFSTAAVIALYLALREPRQSGARDSKTSTGSAGLLNRNKQRHGKDDLPRNCWGGEGEALERMSQKETRAPTKAALATPAKAHSRTALGGAPFRERPSTASTV